MKRVFLLLVIFSFFSCRDVFRININLSEDPLGESNLGEATENFGEATESKDSLPKKSVEGESLIDSDVFVVTQNVSVGEGKQITDTLVINFANFGKPDERPEEDFRKFQMYPSNDFSSTVKTKKTVSSEIPVSDHPQRYLDFLPFNDGKTDGPVYSKVYSNTTSTPERQSLSSEELDNADFRDFYMPRVDASTNYEERFKPINSRNMKVNSEICRIYFEEELYQIYINGGGKYCIPAADAKDEEFMQTRAQEIGDMFYRIFPSVSSVMGEPVYKMLDNDKNPVDMVDKKINIVFGRLSQWLDTPPGSTPLGYFSSKDYSVFDPDLYGIDNPNGSNESLCFYISDALFVYDTNYIDMLYETLAHELTHMLNYGQKTITHRASYSTWFTECLAEIIEDGVAYITDGKTNSPGSFVGTTTPFWFYDATDYHVSVGSGEWDGDFAYTAYQMMAAFLVRNFGGIGLLKEVGTSEYCDFEAWDHAIAKYSTDPDVYDLKSAMAKYPLAHIAMGGYPQTVSTKYSFFKSVSNNLLNFDTLAGFLDSDGWGNDAYVYLRWLLNARLKDSGSFFEPYERYSLPTRAFKALDFHIEHLGKYTADSTISFDNLADGLTYSLVFRTPNGTVESYDLRELLK